MSEERREGISEEMAGAADAPVVAAETSADATAPAEDRATSGLRSATETIERARREAEIAKGLRDREDAEREREGRERADGMARRSAEDEKRARRLEEERLAALSYAEDYRRRLRDERKDEAARARAAARARERELAAREERARAEEEIESERRAAMERGRRTEDLLSRFDEVVAASSASREESLIPEEAPAIREEEAVAAVGVAPVAEPAVTPAEPSVPEIEPADVDEGRISLDFGDAAHILHIDGESLGDVFVGSETHEIITRTERVVERAAEAPAVAETPVRAEAAPIAPVPASDIPEVAVPREPAPVYLDETPAVGEEPVAAASERPDRKEERRKKKEARLLEREEMERMLREESGDRARRGATSAPVKPVPAITDDEIVDSLADRYESGVTDATAPDIDRAKAAARDLDTVRILEADRADGGDAARRGRRMDRRAERAEMERMLLAESSVRGKATSATPAKATSAIDEMAIAASLDDTFDVDFAGAEAPRAADGKASRRDKRADRRAEREEMARALRSEGERRAHAPEPAVIPVPAIDEDEIAASLEDRFEDGLVAETAGRGGKKDKKALRRDKKMGRRAERDDMSRMLRDESERSARAPEPAPVAKKSAPAVLDEAEIAASLEDRFEEDLAAERARADERAAARSAKRDKKLEKRDRAKEMAAVAAGEPARTPVREEKPAPAEETPAFDKKGISRTVKEQRRRDEALIGLRYARFKRTLNRRKEAADLSFAELSERDKKDIAKASGRIRSSQDEERQALRYEKADNDRYYSLVLTDLGRVKLPRRANKAALMELREQLMDLLARRDALNVKLTELYTGVETGSRSKGESGREAAERKGRRREHKRLSRLYREMRRRKVTYDMRQAMCQLMDARVVAVGIIAKNNYILKHEKPARDVARELKRQNRELRRDLKKTDASLEKQKKRAFRSAGNRERSKRGAVIGWVVLLVVVLLAVAGFIFWDQIWAFIEPYWNQLMAFVEPYISGLIPKK